jgi:hypothetical protein
VELKCNQFFWFPWNETSTWALFLVNDHTIVVDCFKSQQMRCVVCHNIQQEVVGEITTQNKKGLVMYIKDHGTITMS